jgi:hypothetical protein
VFFLRNGLEEKDWSNGLRDRPRPMLLRWTFLWGTIKDKVYRDRPLTAEDMKDRIHAACNAITKEIVTLAQRVHVKRL